MSFSRTHKRSAQFLMNHFIAISTSFSPLSLSLSLYFLLFLSSLFSLSYFLLSLTLSLSLSLSFSSSLSLASFSCHTFLPISQSHIRILSWCGDVDRDKNNWTPLHAAAGIHTFPPSHFLSFPSFSSFFLFLLFTQNYSFYE